MPKKFTHEEFLAKLWEKNEHYRNGEFEVVSEYVNYSTPILVRDCKGICKIDYASLVNNNYVPSILSAINKTEYFKNEVFKSNKFYREGCFKIVGDYKGRLNKINVENKYGMCSIYTSQLLSNCQPTILASINPEKYASEILKESNYDIWKDIEIIKYFDYSKVRISTKYGDMDINFGSLLKSDYLSIQSAVDKTDFWIKRALDLRKYANNIDYSKVVYDSNKEHVSLTCRIHNYEYTQRPSHHMANIQGCPHCATSTIKYSKENFDKHREFFKDRRGIIYVLKLIGNNECFYKVGITGRDEKYRFTTLSQSYKVKIEFTEEMLIEEAYNLEQRFLKEFENHKYTPKIKFKGYTECLTTNPVAEYYHWFNNK